MLAIGAAAACLVTAIVAASAATGQTAGLEVTARVAMVGVPIAVGVLAWRRQASARFGRNLTVVGFGWFVSFLAGSSDPLLYSTGRVAGWVVEVGLIYLILSFPSGRLRDRVDRGLVAASVVLVVVMYLPTALIVDGYPVPSPWTLCTHDCPANAFQVTNAEPAFIEAWWRPLREILTVVLFGLVAARVAARVVDARRLLRRALAPVLVVACARLSVFAVGLPAREAAPESDLVAAGAWTLAAAVPIMSLAFLVGLLRWRLFIGSALERLSGRAFSHASPQELRSALAEAFDDPALEILYWLPVGSGCWLDADGRTVVPPPEGSHRTLSEVRESGRLVAAIVHDDALKEERSFIRAGATFALATLENERLAARTSALLREVDESRARIAATADEERRRIERDLHDGAQQRLVALRIRISLAAERLAVDRQRGVELVEELGRDVEAALEDVRALAHGVYPAPLVDRGLADALRTAGAQAPLPVAVVAQRTRRYPMTIESAAYFCCLEAIQNAGKHAIGASRVVVTLMERNDNLWLEVADDGPGFDVRSADGGAGLVNMRDRLRAVRGELAVDSRPGRGTRIVGTIPLRDAKPRDTIAGGLHR